MPLSARRCSRPRRSGTPSRPSSCSCSPGPPGSPSSARPGGAGASLAGIAATGLVLFNVAIVRGVAHAEPAVIAVAVACVPILLGVLGPLLERRAPRRHVLLGAAVVTAGSVLVVGGGVADPA